MIFFSDDKILNSYIPLKKLAPYNDMDNLVLNFIFYIKLKFLLN